MRAPSQSAESFSVNSSLGQCIKSWIATRGHLLIALESYFDGSKDSGDWMASRNITLAGFAAEDDVWAEFDRGWEATLAATHRRPKAKYLHMRELNSLEGEFSWRNDWNRTRTHRLIWDLLMYLQTMDKKRFHMFAATLDMQAYRNLAAAGLSLPDPFRVCNDFSCDVALAWYVREYPGIIHGAHYFFDPGEPFEDVFRKRCLAEQANILDASGTRESWLLIKTITSILDSRDKPAMQAADLLAWASNRNLTSKEDRFGYYIHHHMKQIIPCHWAFIGEEMLRNYRPPLAQVALQL
jgi:hypothetical protein